MGSYSNKPRDPRELIEKCERELEKTIPEDQLFRRTRLAELYRKIADKPNRDENCKDLLLKAMEHARIGANNFSKDSVLQQLAGNTAFKLGFYEEAAGYFKKILDLHDKEPNNPDYNPEIPASCYANCMLKMKKFDEAQIYAEKLIESTAPKNKSIGLFTAAKAALGKKDLELVLQYSKQLSEIKTIDPRNFYYPHILSSLAFAESQNYEKALESAKVLTRSTYQSYGHSCAAYALLKRNNRKDYAEALRHIRAIQRNYPNDPVIEYSI